MGCSPQRKSLTSKYSLSLYNKSSLVSLDLLTSRCNSLQDYSQPYSRVKCIKEKTYPDNFSILTEDLDLSGCFLSSHCSKYTSEYKFIKDTCSKFTKLCHDFSSVIHEVCITGYQVHDGIFLMLVSVSANKSNNLKFLKSFPYFKCKKQLHEETSKILKSWTDFSTFLETLSKLDFATLRRAKSQLEDFLSLIHQKPCLLVKENISRSIFLCQCAILICANMIKKVGKLKKKIDRFFHDIKKKESEIKDCGQRAGMQNCYSASDILHQILRDTVN